MVSKEPRTRSRWIVPVAALGTFTVLLLGLARLFGWLSSVQINYLAN